MYSVHTALSPSMAILAVVRDSNTLETDLPKFISIPVYVLHVSQNLVKTIKHSMWTCQFDNFFEDDIKFFMREDFFSNEEERISTRFE